MLLDIILTATTFVFFAISNPVRSDRSRSELSLLASIEVFYLYSKLVALNYPKSM